MFKSIFGLLLPVAIAFAQTTGTATLVGTVTDNTGAVVPGASVKIVNTETQFVYNGLTSPEGAYYVPNLIPGTYRLTIEATGFKRYIREGVILRTSEQPRIDVKLEVGAVTESIQVEASAPLLETETTATGQILEGETIVKIPVLQKYAFRILLYLPSTSNINGQHVVGQRERSHRIHNRRNRRQGTRALHDRFHQPGHFHHDRCAPGGQAVHHGHARRVRPLRRRPAFDRCSRRGPTGGTGRQKTVTSRRN